MNADIDANAPYTDCRRHIRPLFLAADGSGKPTPHKRYYDVASYLATQLAFSFTVMPFVLLSFSASATAWARVYIYCIVGVAASMAFFASPGKAWLKQQLAARMKAARSAASSDQGSSAIVDTRRLGDELSKKVGMDLRPVVGRNDSRESLTGPALGMPDDPGQDLDEIMSELKAEVALRRSRGQSIGQGLQEAVQQVQEKSSELRKRQTATTS